MQIFEGATTYPIIMIARNDKNSSNQFRYIKILKENQSFAISIDSHKEVLVTQNKLDANNWSFRSDRGNNIIEELCKLKNVKEIYGKCYYGVKTALNEAFIIPKTYKVDEHVKPILEGKELSKWCNSNPVQQLVFLRANGQKYIRQRYN